MVDDEIRPVPLGNVEHLRADLDSGRWHGEGAELEPLALLQFLNDRHRLVAGGIVVEDVGDLLALEVPAQLVLDELYGCGALRPVGRRHREQVRIARPVGRRRDAEPGRGRRDLVFFQPLVERHRHRRAVQGHQHRAFLLVALISFDRGRDLVLVVDLVDLELVPLNPAAGIDQVVIIVHRRAQHDTGDLRRTGAVALHPDHHFA